MPERRDLLKNDDLAGFMHSSILNQRLIGQGHFLISPGLNSVLRAYRTNYFVQICWVTARCINLVYADETGTKLDRRDHEN